jgi:hypothetical protein
VVVIALSIEAWLAPVVVVGEGRQRLRRDRDKEDGSSKKSRMNHIEG